MMILRVLSEVLASYPINPVILAWTLGAMIALPLALWLYIEARYDRTALRDYDGPEDPVLMERVARINERWAYGRLSTAAAFLVAGLVSLGVEPRPLPDNPVAAVKNLVTLVCFLYAEFTLVSSSWGNVRDRFWAMRHIKSEDNRTTCGEYELEIERLEKQADLLRVMAGSPHRRCRPSAKD